MYLTYRYRLSPTRAQARAMRRMLDEQRALYNAALEQRIWAYGQGKSLTLFEQQTDIASKNNPEHAWLKQRPANYWRGPLVRLDRAYKAFFDRLKKGGKAGFPRFRGRDGYDTICFAAIDGVAVKAAGRTIKFKGMPGNLKARLHRPLPDGTEIKGISLTRVPGGWDVLYQIKIADVSQVSPTSWIGVDVGLETFATLSDGFKYERVRHEKKARAKVRRLQRAFARKKRGSGQRRRAKGALGRMLRKVANQRDTLHHQVSAELVRKHDFIAFEDLNIKGLASGMLAKSVHDAGWARFIFYATYKAEKAGKTVKLVDPRGTSQACSACGAVVKKTLSMRRHICGCGVDLDRDHNAARNILNRALAAHGAMTGPEGANVGPLYGSLIRPSPCVCLESGEALSLGPETQPFLAESNPQNRSHVRQLLTS